MKREIDSSRKAFNYWCLFIRPLDGQRMRLYLVFSHSLFISSLIFLQSLYEVSYSTHKLYTITRWEDKMNAENWPNALTKLLSGLGRPSRGRWGSNGSPECRQIRIVNSCGFDTCHTNGLIRWEQWSRTKAYRHFKHRASLFINLLRRLPGERCKGIKCDLCAIIRVIHANVATAGGEIY